MSPAPRLAAAATPLPAPPVARVRSWLLDWLVVVAWLGVLAVGGLVLRPVLPSGEVGSTTGRQLLLADLLITLGTVLPYLLYLALTESSSRRATLGKRWAGLRVAAFDGSRPSTAAVWLRNLVKVLPWQLGHLGFTRAMFETQVGLGIGLSVAGTLLGLACALPALTGARGVHDLCARTRVESVVAPAGGPGRGS